MQATQTSLFYIPPTEKKEKQKARRAQVKQARTVRETLQTMRKLREEINEILYNSAKERPKINSPADAAALIVDELSMQENEVLFVILLNQRNHVIQITQLYSGSVNTAQVRVGEIFKEAIRHNAPAIIVAHNHPSGDTSPSPDDVAITRAINEAGKLLDIELLDHLIIAAGRHVSLKERGLGFS